MCREENPNSPVAVEYHGYDRWVGRKNVRGNIIDVLGTIMQSSWV